jgi:hypothetical protein
MYWNAGNYHDDHESKYPLRAMKSRKADDSNAYCKGTMVAKADWNAGNYHDDHDYAQKGNIMGTGESWQA